MKGQGGDAPSRTRSPASLGLILLEDIWKDSNINSVGTCVGCSCRCEDPFW